MLSPSILPNLLTSLNLLFGCTACIFAFFGSTEEVYVLLILAVVMDFFDGFLARKLNVTSDFGVQLDSLADLVSFGLAPGILYQSILLNRNWNEAPDVSFSWLGLSIEFVWVPIVLVGFILTLGVALRLAKFNIGESKKNFTGLPSPAMALLVVPLPLIAEHNHFSFLSGLTNSNLGILCTVIMASVLLFLPIKMIKLIPSFKQDLGAKITFLFSSVVLIFFYQVLAIPLIVIVYILINLVKASIRR